MITRYLLSPWNTAPGFFHPMVTLTHTYTVSPYSRALVAILFPGGFAHFPWQIGGRPGVKRSSCSVKRPAVLPRATPGNRVVWINGVTASFYSITNDSYETPFLKARFWASVLTYRTCFPFETPFLTYLFVYKATSVLHYLQTLLPLAGGVCMTMSF